MDIHAAWGGVVPKLAQEAHEAAMDSTVEQALQQAGVQLADLEAVAVTVGPGLSLCLKVTTRDQYHPVGFPARDKVPSLHRQPKCGPGRWCLKGARPLMC